MAVNYRKKYCLHNKTNYFNPSKDRTHVQFSSPLSYQSRKMKIEGYESRLYWEFRYCDEHSGQTFFYTFTYNDNNMPQYDGLNCFDYEDIRYLTNGALVKHLLRNYGTKMKYFVSAELGDGKGSRGMHNNPHYHMLFFLRPAENSTVPYKPITVDEMTHIVRMYWQGFDESVDGFRDYKTAKYGIVREGELGAKVKDAKAIQYCAKYVCKDVKLIKHEKTISHELTLRFKSELLNSSSTLEDYYWSNICPKYNIPTKCHLDEIHHDYLWSPSQMLEKYNEDAYKINIDTIGFSDLPLCIIVPDLIDGLNLRNDYTHYINNIVNEKVKLSINEYRNRYCNKCRISQGVGDYALESMDKDEPRVPYPTKKGFKFRPLSMYYFRKLFTDVVKDINGNPIRVLNADGIAYKVKKLDSSISKLSKDIKSKVDVLTPSLYDMMLASDVNTDVNRSFTYERFMDYLINNNEKIYDNYAKFKLIYENRYFAVSDDYAFPTLNYKDDYLRFIQPSYNNTAYNPFALLDCEETDFDGYLPYTVHPDILPNLRLFGVFDLLVDYFFVQGDAKSQNDAEEVAKTKRFHSQEKLKDFYKFFKN